MNSGNNIINKLKRIKNNCRYLLQYDLFEREIQRTYELTDKIIEDCVYEYEEDKNIVKRLNILDEEASTRLLLNYPKSFCRFGDGEIKLMMGISQAFQKYDPKLAKRLKDILDMKRKDMYVGINRAYFHTPIKCSEENRRFYRINSYKYRHFFIEHCNEDNVYLDAGFLTAYYRFDDNYDYASHYKQMVRLFDGKKIAIICGKGILEKLEYDVFCKAAERMVIQGPAKHAYAQYDRILEEIKNNVPIDYVICLILGMTAKVLVPELTDLGYMAWDVGHLAKDYDVYMRKVEKTPDNISNFWAPD